MDKTSSRGSFDPARLEAFLKTTGLSYRPTSKSFIFTCPKCDKEDKLWIFRHSGNFVCFVCRETEGFSGAAEWALAPLTGRSVADIRKELYGVRNYQSATALVLDFGENEDDDFDEMEEVAELAEVEWPYDCYPLDHKWSKNGLLYLQGRGIPEDLATEYGIRYCPPRRSVAFPVTSGTKLVGWQFRIIDPELVVLSDGTVSKRLKTISDAGDADFPRDRVVMFEQRLVGAEAAVVCEGPVDAIKAHLVGGNIATMGKAISEAQIQILLRSGVKTIYLALDPDAASEITPLMFRFGTDVEFRRVRIPKGKKDLGAMELEAARDAIMASPIVEPAKELELYFKGEELVLPGSIG